ncbi:MAG: hypothetical protein NPIRA02_23770 [Nitrospirales bacterium]|nr:MAG: hypothetical protein NPIRA02_23770 [Nitrospirales bacterium]
MLNKDYKEMLSLLIGHKVKFLVVGAYALGVHGYPRATGDVDVWVEPSPENSKFVYDSLVAFGAPVSQLTQEAFSEEGIVFQIGVAPRRIDILTKIDGVSFSEAYVAREEIDIEGLIVPFLSKPHLIQNKEATGREKDKIDAQQLKERSGSRDL